LHRLGFRHVSARPQHPRQDTQALDTHKKTLPNSLRLQSPNPPGASLWNSGGRTRHGSDSRAP
jgi:hypothetical protein